jgi:hypothetical protein
MSRLVRGPSNSVSLAGIYSCTLNSTELNVVYLVTVGKCSFALPTFREFEALAANSEELVK